MVRFVPHLRKVAPAVAFAALLAGCGSLSVSDPVNRPITGSAENAFASTRTDPTAGDDVLVGLAFSGGGTRAAAFAYGVLSEIDQTTIHSRNGTHSLLNSVGFVSGVSGGAVTAAYYALKKREALADFREKFLIRNAEEGISTSIEPVNLMRAMGGGVNDVRTFSNWLDANLFHGATFADFRKTPGPRVWINASDIYNRTPFIYGEAAFIALCSDLASYPIAEAVAASAAVPIVFTPMVIKTYPKQCNDKPPQWLQKAHDNPNSPPLLKAFADALYSYQDGSTKYIKLLDGGLVDNFGLSGFTISRLVGTVSPRAAVAGAGGADAPLDRDPGRCRPRTVRRLGADRRGAERRRSDHGGVRHGGAGERPLELHRFRAHHVRLAAAARRLALRAVSEAQRKRYGAPANWNCRDIKFYVNRVSFEQLGPERAKVLNAVDTRLKLPVKEVDAVIAAGHDALRASPTFREFLRGVGGRAVPAEPPAAPAEPESTPVAVAPAPEVASAPGATRSAFAAVE